MARIVSVSYDETLLRTRQLLLEREGHEVTSALGYHDAMLVCASPADLFIIGHSIPKNDKQDLIACCRKANPSAKVVALTRANEDRLKEVDAYISPGDPEELMRAIDLILNPASERRLRRVK